MSFLEDFMLTFNLSGFQTRQFLLNSPLLFTLSKGHSNTQTLKDFYNETKLVQFLLPFYRQLYKAETLPNLPQWLKLKLHSKTLFLNLYFFSFLVCSFFPFNILKLYSLILKLHELFVIENTA